MTWYREAFGAHYAVLYAHRDTAEARRCVAWLLARLPLRDGPVLDLGCGAGRHLALLREAGVRAVGLDLSADLLAAARRRAGVAAPLLRGDMRALPLRDGRLAAVLSLFTAFGYFGALADHDPVLAEVARVLAPGGWWVLDYLDAAAVRRELAAGPRADAGGRGPLRWRARRFLAPGGDRVVKEIAVTPAPGEREAAARLGIPPGGRRFREEVALFTPEELAPRAGAHGLRLEEVAGDYDGSPATPGAPRRIMLLRREATTG